MILVALTHQDRLAVQRVFVQKAKHECIWLPKIVVLQDLQKRSFEELWHERFEQSASLHDALQGDFQKPPPPIEYIRSLGSDIYTAGCFDEYPEFPKFSIDLPHGTLQGTMTCDSLQEEAMNIAFLVRKKIEAHRIAIVIDQPHLKHFIIQELKRWNISVPHKRPLTHKYTLFLSLLEVRLEFSHKALLTILDHLSPKTSTYLNLHVLRGKPCSYEKIKKYLPDFLNPYFSTPKDQPFYMWCEDYKEYVPAFWHSLPIGICTLSEFYHIAKTLLFKGSFYQEGNTTRIHFYHSKSVSYPAEDFVILAGMTGESSLCFERFNRCMTAPFIYMTKTGASSSAFWQDIAPQNPYNIQRKPLVNLPAVGNPPKRPYHFSVTEIEKLIRDPYAIYAKKCLQLKPLGELDTPWRSVDFGILLHRILEKSFQNDLYEQGKEILKTVNQPLRYLFWWSRFERLYPWIMAQGVAQNVEVESQIVLGAFTLFGRIDRISMDGQIVDYKTGSPPTQKDIYNGYSPQLPVEALMLLCSKAEIWHLGQHISKTISLSIDLADVQEKLETVLNRSITIPYRACPIPSKAPFFNPYQHLERI